MKAIGPTTSEELHSQNERMGRTNKQMNTMVKCLLIHLIL